MAKVAPYYKAVAGALVAFLSALVAALNSGDHISPQEWVTALIALVVGAGAVFAIPNEHPINQPPAAPAPPAAVPPETPAK